MGQAESGLAFEKEDILAELQSRVVLPQDSLWDHLFSAANTFAHINISFKELSDLFSLQPVNIAVLLYRLATDLYASSRKTPLPITEMKQRLRWLTWLVPTILSHKNHEMRDVLLFQKGPLVTKILDAIPRRIVHPPSGITKKIEGPEISALELRVPGSDATLSVAESITKTLTELLFHPGFTISPSATIWAIGIGCNKSGTVTYDMIQHRIEVIRAILACLSFPLYQTGNNEDIKNPWLDLFCSDDVNTKSWEMFCSFLNVALGYDPVGWGLPYHYLIASDDSNEVLAEVSLQCLLVLCNRHNAVDSNVFQLYLGALGEDSVADFTFLYGKIVSLLGNPLHAKKSFLPSSGKPIQSSQELLLLFWTLISCNQDFLQHILNKEDITLLCTPLFYFMLDHRENENRTGFLHLIGFTLLLLSGERKYGVQLNRNFPKKMIHPSLPSFSGSYNDGFILLVHKMFTDSSPRVVGLRDTLLTILVNTSPFITTLTMTAAMKMAKLFELFATPKNLLFHKDFHRYVHLLLEAFNNLIQYQYAGNPSVVYSVVHHHQLFKNLTNLRIRSSVPAQERKLVSEELQDVREDGDENNPSIDKKEDNENPPVKWIPTNEWLQDWKAQLPLSTTIRLINAVLSDVLAISEQKDSNATEKILEYLKTPLVGLLPVPHPILTRRFQENEATNLWLQRYTWSVVVSRNKSAAFFGTSAIQLFAIGIAPQE